LKYIYKEASKTSGTDPTARILKQVERKKLFLSRYALLPPQLANVTDVKAQFSVQSEAG
jgi:hypothetical protein